MASYPKCPYCEAVDATMARCEKCGQTWCDSCARHPERNSPYPKIGDVFGYCPYCREHTNAKTIFNESSSSGCLGVLVLIALIPAASVSFLVI